MRDKVYNYVVRLRERYAKGVKLTDSEITEKYMEETCPLPEAGRPLLHSVKSYLVVLRRGAAKEGAKNMSDLELISMVQGVVNKYGVRFFPHNTGENYDLAMDIYLHFKTKGFMEKFNPLVCEIHYFIWMGCRNYMIDQERKSRGVTFTSYDADYSTPDKEIKLEDEVLVQMTLRTQMIHDLVDLLQTEEGWGDVRETPLGKIKLSLWSVTKLYLEGYKPTEIGKIFNISRLRVVDLYNEAVAVLKVYVQNRDIPLPLA